MTAAHDIRRSEGPSRWSVLRAKRCARRLGVKSSNIGSEPEWVSIGYKPFGRDLRVTHRWGLPLVMPKGWSAWVIDCRSISETAFKRGWRPDGVAVKRKGEELAQPYNVGGGLLMQMIEAVHDE